VGFSAFSGWVVCNLATAYTEHQICMQRAWIISREAIDVPFGVIDCTDNGGPANPKNFEFQQFILSSPFDAVKFAEFNWDHYFRHSTKIGDYIKLHYIESYLEWPTV